MNGYDEHYYGIGDIILFKISDYRIIIDHNRIWKVLKNKFNLSPNEMIDLLNTELNTDKKYICTYNSDMYGSWLSTH